MLLKFTKKPKQCRNYQKPKQELIMCEFVHIIVHNCGGAPHSTEQVGKSSSSQVGKSSLLFCSLFDLWNFYILYLNWLSHLHFYLSHQSTTGLSINKTKYPESVLSHFQNLSESSLVHNLPIPQISVQIIRHDVNWIPLLNNVEKRNIIIHINSTFKAHQ